MIEELQITQEDITERTPLRYKLHNFEGFQEKLKEEDWNDRDEWRRKIKL